MMVALMADPSAVWTVGQKVVQMVVVKAVYLVLMRVAPRADQMVDH